MRYARVQGVLEQEDAFVAKMGSRTEAVFKPDGEKQLFSPEVIAVTQAIHNAGKDAHKVHKTEIVRIACQVFQIGRAAPVTNGVAIEAPAPVITAPEPVKQVVQPETPKAPKAAPKAAKAVRKPAPKPPIKPKAKAVAAPSAPAAPAATKPAPEPPKAEEPVTKPAAATAEVAREASLEKVKELLNQERPGENQAAFNAYISMYSMTLTVLQLVEIYDKQAGNEKRFKILDELAKEFNKFTSIKSAKEAQKTQS
jgi:outer membrane biosynthesis protein TonB